MTRLQRYLALSLVLLTGCTSDSNEQKSQTDANLQTLQQDKVQTLALGSLTERFLGMPQQKILPVIGQNWVVQAQDGYLEFYRKNDQQKFGEIDGIHAYFNPVFVDDNQLLVADSQQNLWLIHIESLEKHIVAHLPAPLICAPLVINGDSIFLQYLNDVVEMMAMDGSSQWRTAIMATTSYFRQTDYAPCASGRQIFFAYPGSSVLAIDQQTGQIDWISSPIAHSAISTTAFQVPQVQSAIKVVGDLVVFSTLDNQLFCLDKDSGLAVKKWSLWQRSPLLVNNNCLYFVNDMGALHAFDGLSQEMLWQHDNFSSLGVESLVALGHNKIVAQMSHQQLYLIDAESGATLNAYQHTYPSLQLIGSDHHQRLFGLDQRKNLIDIPGTLLS